jgi:transposase
MDRKAYNADLVGAYNVLITPSPERDRGNGPETRPGIEPSGKRGCNPKPPRSKGTIALQGGEEVSEH